MSSMIKVEKGNVVLSIKEEDLTKYESKGYCKLGATKKVAPKDIQKEMSKLSKENEKLKSANEELKVEKEELLKKIEDLEKVQVGTDGEKEDKNEK